MFERTKEWWLASVLKQSFSLVLLIWLVHQNYLRMKPKSNLFWGGLLFGGLRCISFSTQKKIWLVSEVKTKKSNKSRNVLRENFNNKKSVSVRAGARKTERECSFGLLALTLTLALFFAPQVRLELTTHGLTVRCSNQLSYWGIFMYTEFISAWQK